MACHAIGLLVVAHVGMTVGARAVGLLVIDIKLWMAEAGVLPIAGVFVASVTRACIMVRRFAAGMTRRTICSANGTVIKLGVLPIAGVLMTRGARPGIMIRRFAIGVT